MVIPNYHTEKPRRFQARAVVLYCLEAKIFARRVKGARQILRRGINIMQQIMTYAAALSKKGFDVRCFGTADEVRRALLAAIPAGASVGIGGSMTIEQLGVESELKSRGCPVYWHWKSAPEQRSEVTKKAFCADFYLMSSNAVSCDGSLWNIDGNGNRLATMLRGTGKLICVIGCNKFTDSDPVERIKREACPKNAVRLHLNTPCAKTGKCTDCKSPDRMCKLTLELRYPPAGRDMEVWLVDEPLGY